MKVFAVLLLLILSPATSTSSALYSSTAAQLKSIERTTQRIRHLSEVHSVKAQVVSDQLFNASLLAMLHRDIADRDIDLAQRESVILGLLKKTDDVRKLTFGASTAQVVGFYDPRLSTLWVRNHAKRAFGPERFNIAHEYTHALQDQHYHLLKFLPDQSNVAYRNTDVIAARHALTEGDAIETQTLFISQTYSRQDVDSLIKLQSRPDTTPPLPQSFRRQLLFPYTIGAAFVDSLYRARGMAGVDAAYRRPPASTYEVMHPSAYVSGWKPANVSLHTVVGFTDWQVIDNDVFGAFGYNLLLRQYLPARMSNSVTNGYRGDRYVLLHRGIVDMVLLKSEWTNAASARSAQKAYLAALRVRFPHARFAGHSAKTAVYANGAVYLSVHGKQLTMAYSPTAQTAQQLGTAHTD